MLPRASVEATDATTNLSTRSLTTLPTNVTLAIDCMGGDHGPHVTVSAAVNFLEQRPAARVILVGREDAIASELARLGKTADAEGRLVIRPAAEVVAMDDAPLTALRGKKDSSMRVAIELVKRGEADACVSAGNTGALTLISWRVLGMVRGIDRPAIVSVLPTMTGTTYMLDLGANVDCTAEHLEQFAMMGATLVSAVEHRERPSVGLLNIGSEVIKGNEVVKQAGERLRASGLNFIGNVEGDDIYKGKCDVIVCDGFVGNVALKTSEGLAQMTRYSTARGRPPRTRCRPRRAPASIRRARCAGCRSRGAAGESRRYPTPSAAGVARR